MKIPKKKIRLPRAVAKSLKVSTLSKRERQVLTLLRQGYEKLDIVKELGIQKRMVGTYMCALYKKAGAETLTQFQAMLGTLRRIPLHDGRFRLGTIPHSTR